MLLSLTVLPLLSATLALAIPSSAPTPTPTLNKRCEGGDCTYGGTKTTLTANTITTTVLSTTSVPCYITTYVTDSTTTTSTVYSTDIITSTITEKGIVTVIKYQPTPVLKSKTYESVLQITQTGTTFWQENEGSAYEETVTGDTQTISGGVSGGKGYDNDYGQNNNNNNGNNGNNGYGGQWSKAGGTTVLLSTAAATGPAWQHATAAAAAGQGVTTINANGAPIAPTAGTDGWAAGANGNTAVVAGATINANGAGVVWNAAGLSRDEVSSLMVVAAALGVVLLFEYCHYMA